MYPTAFDYTLLAIYATTYTVTYKCDSYAVMRSVSRFMIKKLQM